jgi:arginyl-tRNA synthetase
VVTELLEKKIATVVEGGAVAIFPNPRSLPEPPPLANGEAPLFVMKSDGGFTYATTDLAAVRQRLRMAPSGEQAR